MFNILTSLDFILCEIILSCIGNSLAKVGEAAKAVSAPKVASERSAVTFPDEQLSTADLELRMKLLREDR